MHPVQVAMCCFARGYDREEAAHKLGRVGYDPDDEGMSIGNVLDAAQARLRRRAAAYVADMARSMPCWKRPRSRRVTWREETSCAH